MTAPRTTTVVLVAGLLALVAACERSPTGAAELPSPTFSKGRPGPPSGNGGGGSEGSLFTPTIVTFGDAAGDGITSDGLGAYSDGDCGVVADFNSLDARLSPNGDYGGKDKHSGCAERSEHITLVDAATGATVLDTDVAAFMNVDHVEEVTPDSGTVEHTGQVNLSFCNILRFDPNDIYVGPNGSGRLEVSSAVDGVTGDTTWTVSTGSNPTAYCESRNELVRVPFSLTVQLQ